MKLRSLNHDSREISVGKAYRFVAHMGLEMIEEGSKVLLLMKDPKIGEYWSLEGDHTQISFLKKLVKLAGGTIELGQLDHMPESIFPDLRSGKVNKNSRKQALIFLLRQGGDYSKQIPSIDERDFWGKVEKAFPLL